MPYSPTQNYIGGQLLASGIGDIGKGIATGLESYQKAIKEHEGDQMVIDYALKNDMITREEHEKYLNGSRSQKNDVVAGLVRTFAMDQARQQSDIAKAKFQMMKDAAPVELDIAKQQLATARGAAPVDLDIKKQQLAESRYQPSPEERQRAEAVGGQLLPTGAGRWTFARYPEGDKGQEQIVTDPLTINGKVIPGIGVNRLTGQYVYFGESGIVKDPLTGAFGVRTRQGDFKALNQQQMDAIEGIMSGSQGTEPPKKSWFQRVFGGGEEGTKPAKQGAPQTNTAAPVNTPPQVKTQEDYNALTSGALYTAPGGSIKRKR